MKPLLLLLLSAFCPAGALAAPYYSLGIKTESLFAADSEHKIEGSGILVKRNGEWLVLTSEHVIVPGNSAAIHRVVVNNEYYEAEWLRSDWEKGLALLRLKTAPKEPEKFIEYRSLVHRKQYFGADETYLNIHFRADLSNHKGARTFGVPAGGYAVRFSSYGVGDRSVPEGEVLAGTRVWAFKGIPAEAGMSGGPVFFGQLVYHGSPESPPFFDRDGFIYYNHFIGLMTHITYVKDLPTYVIPIDTVELFMDVARPPALARGVKELQALYHGKDNPEIVVAEASGLRLVKVKGQFWVTAPKDEPSLETLALKYPGLVKLGKELLAKGLKSVRLVKIGAETLDATTPLAKFAKLLSKEEPVELAK